MFTVKFYFGDTNIYSVFADEKNSAMAVYGAIRLYSCSECKNIFISNIVVERVDSLVLNKELINKKIA